MKLVPVKIFKMKNSDVNFMVIVNIKIVKKKQYENVNSIYQTATLWLIRYDPSCVLYNLDSMWFFCCKPYGLQSEMIFTFIYFLNYLNIDDCR